MKICGFNGSLRERALSRMLLETMVEKFPGRTEFVCPDIGCLPHYNPDLEKMAVPPQVAVFRKAIVQSDMVLITTPEYNHAIPGVLKNALDWASRPVFSSCMLNKPVLFATESEGALGGARAQHSLREILSSMRCYLPPMPEIVVTFASGKFIDGQLQDKNTHQFLQNSIELFLAGLCR